MKIRFKEDFGVTVIDGYGFEQDEFFFIGEELEGEIFYDGGEYVTFGSVEGYQIHGLKKTQFEEVRDERISV